MPHHIRLLGFWSCAATAGLRYRHVRHFGRPRTLDAGERVWLTGEGLAGPAEVAVNGHVVGHVAEGGLGFAFDVTSFLQVRNELAMTLSSEDGIGEMILEIRSES